MSKHINNDENAQALAWRRANMLRKLRGTPQHPRPTTISHTADLRAYDYLTEQYAETEALIDQTIPTNRFTDDMLWIIAAIKWHILAEWNYTPKDTPGWHQTRNTIKQAITKGHIKVLGASDPPGQLKIARLISEFYHLTDPTGWVTHHRGFTGVATYLIPTDTFLTALHTLPQIRQDTPLLAVPSFPPPFVQQGTPLYYPVGASDIGVDLRTEDWMNLRTDVVGKTTPEACWQYDNKLGRKAAVLWALRRAGVAIRDEPTGDYYHQHWTNPETGGVVIIPRAYHERWVKPPASMSLRQLIHIVEGKL